VAPHGGLTARCEPRKSTQLPVFAKKQGLNRRAGPPVHGDLIDRQFQAEAPNAVWLTGITEHPTGGGKLYP
jgi:putative transposase